MGRTPRASRRGRWVGAVVALGAITLTACGSSGDSSGTTGGGSASAGNNGSKEIVAFLPPTSDPYAANWLKNATTAAGEAGYKIRAVQTADSSAAASQVQQALGNPNKPAAFIWWPVEPEAQVGSLRALSRSKVPVFQANQLPVKGSEDFITAYTGVSDIVVGEVAGKAAVEARDTMKERGDKLHSEGGNALVVALPVGYGATRDRLAGFKTGIEGSGLNIIDVGNAKGFSAQDAFTVTSQLISANRGKGIDVVYGQMDDFSVGAIRALEQAGYKPGKNVEVIGGSCHGDDSPAWRARSP
jgi:ABC-type sugar transport system substrate-binding protein